MEDEGYVKPASKESRLVMVQLEPSAEEVKWCKADKKTKKKERTRKENNTLLMQVLIVYVL